MIKFEHVNVYNLDGALRGMRNSWGSHEKSDSKWGQYSVDNETGKVMQEYIIGPNDFSLAMKLSKAGSDHAKLLRQIFVAVDITSDSTWWGEVDTYKVGTVANSTSTMHTLGKGGTVDINAFGFDNPDDPLVQKYYNEIILPAVKEWVESGKKKPSYEWRRMIHLNARGFLYTRHMTLNYQVLKAWYHSRRLHRYEEWHSVADWIESFPYSQLITLKE